MIPTTFGARETTKKNDIATRRHGQRYVNCSAQGKATIGIKIMGAISENMRMNNQKRLTRSSTDHRIIEQRHAALTRKLEKDSGRNQSTLESQIQEGKRTERIK